MVFIPIAYIINRVYQVLSVDEYLTNNLEKSISRLLNCQLCCKMCKLCRKSQKEKEM